MSLIRPLFSVYDKDNTTCEVQVCLLIDGLKQPPESCPVGNRFCGTPQECVDLVIDFCNIMINDALDILDRELHIMDPSPFYVETDDPNSPSQQFILLLSERQMLQEE